MPTDQTPKKELNMPNTKTCPSLFFGESHSFRPWKGIVLGKWNQLNKYKTKKQMLRLETSTIATSQRRLLFVLVFHY
jgi:hypothetical protein